MILVRAEHLPKDDFTLAKYTKGKIHITGIVSDDPDIKNATAKFVLKVTKVNSAKIDDVHVKNNSKLLVKIDTPDIAYGDEIEIFTKIEKPKEIVNPDGRTFDYAAYLSKDGIFYTASVRSLASSKVSASTESAEGSKNFRIISRGHGNIVIASLYKFKHAFIERIDRALPSPHSFLASGLIISGKGSLDKKLQDDFQRVGLIHIVVLSGFNISIIGEAIVRLFSFLPASLSAICGGFGVVLFSIMTGGGSTVIRSAIMSLIGLYARISGRTNSALVSLMVTGTLMLIWNPRLAIYDPSFQLSFTATLALILYASPIESRLKRLITASKSQTFQNLTPLISLISSTLATQIFTLPLIIKLSGIVSLVALPINIVVLPFIPFTMFFVFLTGCLCFILPLVATVPAFVSYILLSYELAMVHFGASLPFASVALPLMSIYMILTSYTGLLLFGIFLYVKNKNAEPILPKYDPKNYSPKIKNTAPI